MSLAAVNGTAVTRANVALGRWGAWYAGVTLADDVELSGVVEFKIGGLTCSCAVVSGGALDGRASYYLVGGRGGWGKSLDAKGYSDDSGVKASKVLQDAADSAGESIAGLPATRLGPHYARLQGPAYRVLADLAPSNWHVDLAGTTRIGTWPESTYTGTAARTRREAAFGVVDLATEDLAGLVPGVVVGGNPAASDVEWTLTSKRLTASIYYAPRANRRLEAFAKIIRALDPWAPYRSLHEFRVVVQSGERFDLQPVRTGPGLPSLRNVPVRPGVAGARNNVTPGENVLVAFVGGDPSRPAIVAHDAPDAPGWMPLSIEFGGPGALGVARQTDAVVAGPYGGAITGGSARVKAVI